MQQEAPQSFINAIGESTALLRSLSTIIPRSNDKTMEDLFESESGSAEETTSLLGEQLHSRVMSDSTPLIDMLNNPALESLNDFDGLDWAFDSSGHP